MKATERLIINMLCGIIWGYLMVAMAWSEARGAI